MGVEPEGRPATPDLRSLLDAAAEGDRDAANELFGRYYTTVVRIVRRQLGPTLRRKVDSMEIVQTSLLEAYRSLPRRRFESEKGFVAWIRRIVLSKIRNRDRLYRTRMRDRSREQRMEGMAEIPAGGLDPKEELILREDIGLLGRAMRKLSADHRRVLVHRHLLKEAWPEIAARLGRSSEAAQMLYQRAIRKLRDEYDGLSTTGPEEGSPGGRGAPGGGAPDDPRSVQG